MAHLEGVGFLRPKRLLPGPPSLPPAFELAAADVGRCRSYLHPAEDVPPEEGELVYLPFEVVVGIC